jgi:hypothetical protein
MLFFFNDILFTLFGLQSVLTGAGGGVSFLGSDIWLRNVTIARNVINAGLAAGGGMSAGAPGYIESTSVVFFENQAIASGDCFYVDKLLQCPSSFGGALFVHATVSVVMSDLSRNSAYCDSRYPCIAHGGAIAVSNLGAVLNMSNSLCVHNAALCHRSGAGGSCMSGQGGCLYGDLGSVTVSAQTSIDSNYVTGIGGGGGVYSAGKLAVTVTKSRVTNNTAREGGGLMAAESSVMRLRGVEISRNVGLSIGGESCVSEALSVCMCLRPIVGFFWVSLSRCVHILLHSPSV